MSIGVPARLGTLPVHACWRPAVPSPGAARVVVQISRGLAACVPMVDAIAEAHAAGLEYWLVAGYPLVEAKNRAAMIAVAEQAQLTLVEDDVVMHREVWSALLAPSASVRFASGRCRDGTPTTYRRADGSVLWSGTAALTVPLAVLRALPSPLFEAREYARVGTDDLAPQAAVTTHTGSDVHFWYVLHKHCPAAVIAEVGEFAHLLNPLTLDRQDHRTPAWTRPA